MCRDLRVRIRLWEPGAAVLGIKHLRCHVWDVGVHLRGVGGELVGFGAAA